MGRSDFSISLELGLPLPCHWCHILPTRLSFDLFDDDRICNIVLLHPVFVSRAEEPAASLIRSWSAALCIHGEGQVQQASMLRRTAGGERSAITS